MTDFGLVVSYGGQRYISNATVQLWDPLPTWRFGIAASTGTSVRQSAVHNITLVTGAFVADQTARVDATRNRQQFTHTPTSYVYQRPPEVSSCSPSSGPASGGTMVRIWGSSFQNGLAYTC
eukprot:2908634-Prymnesium_polylepis.1